MTLNLNDGLIKILLDYPKYRDYFNIRKKSERNLVNLEIEREIGEYKIFLNEFKSYIYGLVSENVENEIEINDSGFNQSADNTPYITIKIKGVNDYYLVYLFRYDGKGVYFGLGLNVFPFIHPDKKSKSFNEKELDFIDNITNTFRNYILDEYNDSPNKELNFKFNDFSDDSNELYSNQELVQSKKDNKKLAKAYSKGMIFCKYYELNKLKEEFKEKDLKNDLSNGIEIYKFTNNYLSEFLNIKENRGELLIDKPISLNLNDKDFSDFLIKQETLDKISSSLNAGQNVILNGVPGTGKTYLATIFAKEAMGEEGYILTTATSDWTTFDTIGGLMPGKGQELEFHEGKFLQAIRENKWLIIDEINRADIDKAFGQLFTVLSKNNIELPFYINIENKKIPIKIKLWENNFSDYDEEEATYYIGKNWRIIATMNSYDKNTLFDMSYAFMRRFMFVEIEVPDNFKNLMNSLDNSENHINFSSLENYYQNKLESLYGINSNLEINRALGPAIFSDIIKYIYFRTDLEEESNDKNNIRILSEAMIAYIIPQFEGLNKEQIDSSIEFFEEEVFDNSEDAKLVVEKLNDLKSYY